MTPLPDDPSDNRSLRPGEFEDAERWAAQVEAAKQTGSYISDEPLDGPSFRVETLSSNGMHEVVDISASSALPDEATHVVLRSVVRAVLDLAGYESGSAHTDVVLTAHGPRISALRLAGSQRRCDE